MYVNNYIVKKAYWQAFFYDNTQFSLQIVNFLLKLNSKYDKIFPSQGNIAAWIGCSRKTVNKHLKHLHDLGWVKKVYRKHRETCMYVLSTKFGVMATLPEARKKLPGLINHYYKLIMTFFSDSKNAFVEPFLSSQKQKVTPYIEENKYISSTSVYLSKRDNRIGSLVQDLQNRFTYKSLKKEEVAMQEGVKIDISPALREVTTLLGLSRHGQIRLKIYDEHALQETLNAFKQGVLTKDPYVWFETYCHGVCIKKGLPIKLELYELMMKRYNISPKSSLLYKTKENSNTYVKAETKCTGNGTINPSVFATSKSNTTISVVGKYKEPDHFWGQFIPEDKRKLVL